MSNEDIETSIGIFTDTLSTPEYTKLANAHWKYIKSVLITHEEELYVIDKCGFHYITAFEHGFKHGCQKAFESGMIDDEQYAELMK